MGLVSRSCIEGIKSRVNIIDVVAPYVSLKKSGATWKGLSPFNNEKTPSFYVIPEKNIFKCFSSGYAGDIFRFLELKENLSFNEAVEAIADRFKIELEYEKGSGKLQEGGSVKKELYEIHEHAMEFFHQCFLGKDELGEVIRKYWVEKRGFSLELAKEYGIGVAPVETHSLLNYLLKQKKYSIEGLKKCGLFFAREQEEEIKYLKGRFRGRLMIPIRDVQGKVVAFAGRQLEMTPVDDPTREAKYINSPETPIFQKGKVLFGLEKARKFVDQAGYFLLVEGQLDTLRCWEHGIYTAIAPQGTGVNEMQLATLRRYCTRLYCVLDGDSPGQRAALRILPMAMKVGLEVFFINIPNGSDPDEFLKEKGRDAFLKKLNEANNPIMFAVRAYSADKVPSSPGEKAKILNQIFGIIACCDSSVIREEYLNEVSGLLHVNHESVQEDFRSYQKTKMKDRDNHFIGKKSSKNNKEKLTTVEYQLLLLILSEMTIANALAKDIQLEWIISETLESKLLLRILGEIREGLWQGEQQLDALLETEEERNFMYTLLGEKHPFENPINTANLCLRQLYTKYLNDRKNKIDNRIANASIHDIQSIQDLQREKIEIRKLVQNLPKMHIELETNTI